MMVLCIFAIFYFCVLWCYAKVTEWSWYDIPHVVVVLGLAVLRFVLYIIVLLSFATPAPLLLLPFPLSHLYSRLMHFYLKKIYSPQFDDYENIQHYVKLDIYLLKCIRRKTKYKMITILILIAVALIAVAAISVTLALSFLTLLIISLYIIFLAAGLWFGSTYAKVYVDTTAERRSCYESAGLDKEIENIVINLGLNNDPYRLFSDHKATIGFLTLNVIALGSLWYMLELYILGQHNTIEETLRKFIWSSTLTSNRDIYEFVQDFLFMSIFYFIPFAFTVRYYAFVSFTLKYLKGLRNQNKSLMNVKEQLKQALIEDISGDVAIPFVLVFLKYVWTGKASNALKVVLSGLDLHNVLLLLIYAVMLVSLMDLPTAPVAYYLKFIVVPAYRLLSKFILRIRSALNLALLKIRSKLCNILIKFYCKPCLTSHSEGFSDCKIHT